MTPESGDLPRAARRRSLALAVPEGVLYAGMVGFAEQWFVVDAIRLGASAFEQALVVGVPLFVGALGPLLVLRWLWHGVSRRKLAVGFVAAQALTLLAIALLDVLGMQTARLLVIGASLYQVCGQGSSPAWASWYADLVPERMRGNYFARRTKAVQYAICLAMVAAGLLLQGLEPRLCFGAETHAWWTAVAAPGRGFALIFALAGLSRFASALLLVLSPEPAFSGIATTAKVFQFLKTTRGSNAWRLVAGSAGFYLTVYLASPFFVPFMAKELGFSYLTLMTALALQIALKAALQRRIGEAIDRHGARAVWLLAVLMCAIVPLPFVWAHGWPWVMTSQLFSGIAWGSFEIAVFVLLLQTTFRTTRPHAVAAQSFSNGLGQVCGSLLGGAFLAASGDSYRVLFAVSLALRVIVAVLLPRLIRPRRDRDESGAKALLWRVVGLAPEGGVTREVELPRPRPRR